MIVFANNLHDAFVLSAGQLACCGAVLRFEDDVLAFLQSDEEALLFPLSLSGYQVSQTPPTNVITLSFAANSTVNKSACYSDFWHIERRNIMAYRQQRSMMEERTTERSVQQSRPLVLKQR